MPAQPHHTPRRTLAALLSTSCSMPALGSLGTLWVLAACCSATSMKGQLLGMASGPHQSGRCMHQACPLAHRLAKAATGHLFQPWLPNVPPSARRCPQLSPESSYRLSSWTTVSRRAWGASFSIAALQGDGGNTGSGPTPGPANPTFIARPSPPPPLWVPAPARAHPLSRRTIHARGAFVPRLPCGSRLTPVARSTLHEQVRQISRFWSKALRASRALGKLSSGADSGVGTSHRPSLQGCRGSPAGQAFRLPRAPPSQGHNKTGWTRTHQYQRVGFGPVLRRLEPPFPPQLTEGPNPSRSLRAPPPGVSHHFRAAPQHFQAACGRLAGTCRSSLECAMHSSCLASLASLRARGSILQQGLTPKQHEEASDGPVTASLG